jgi:putative ABC transport system permease protein
MSQDNQCYVTIPCIRQQFSDENRSYRVACKVEDASAVATLAEEAMGLMRVVRRDRPGEDLSFNVSMSNSLVDTLQEATSGITMAATIIGIITLFGAGIGLMNIMLVSVSERTREIGTRKALGATPNAIRMQFLIEVIIIGQLGGAVGIVLGLAAGNGIAYFMETPFVMPLGWMISGVVLSLITSIASGYYPARQAAKLDPIVALGRE